MRPLLLAVLALTPPQHPSAGPAAPERTLSVFAAASLTAAFGEVGDSLAARRPGLRIRYNFAGSQQLAAQLAEGAPADLFASADRRWMDDVTGRGLASGEPVVFARNRLVVVVPAKNPGHVERLQDLARPGLVLVLAGSAVPVGEYSRETLARLGDLPGFPAGFARAALANLASEEENVKAVLTKVQLGEADAGIVYRSDITPAAAAAVRVLRIPDAANVLAEYPVVALAHSALPEDARAFVALLLSAAGQRILGAHGLLPAKPPA